ncbi:putative receptor [Escherichia coli]|uniref:Putative receptor n=1 Tax=Escherichia coli TaxID=562 RepID=A0A377BJM2_ECOLX|nr:putative receptor [Escherichia coli]
MVDTRNGNILAKVAAPESLAVLFNPARNEAYVTHRQAGKVSVIDAKSYKVVKLRYADSSKQPGAVCRWQNAVCQCETKIH